LDPWEAAEALAQSVENAMKWAAKDSVRSNAGRVLPKIARAYFEAGTALFAGEKTPERLHEFRLRTKHFRYTLELFEEHYDARFATLLKRLKPVQEALGDINDAATALAWLAEEDAAAVKQRITDRIARQSARFERYWTTVFDKAGEQTRWLTVLAAPSARGGETGSLRRRSRPSPDPVSASL